MDHDTQELKELEEGLSAQAHKLALFLYGATFPDEMKEALVALLSEMSPEQISRLLDIFEAQYADEMTRATDEEFREKIQKIVSDFEGERAAAETLLVHEINAL